MKGIEEISIRGRMAYLLCLFERLLIYFHCSEDKWNWILEKLWQYTEIQYLDEWMYEVAEFLPENILTDPFEVFEFISERDYLLLKKIYKENCADINLMMNIIYDLGTMELYSKLENNSPFTLQKLQEAENVLLRNNIQLISIHPFEQYLYSEENGWGERFNGKIFSIFIH